MLSCAAAAVTFHSPASQSPSTVRARLTARDGGSFQFAPEVYHPPGNVAHGATRPHHGRVVVPPLVPVSVKSVRGERDVQRGDSDCRRGAWELRMAASHG